MHWHVVKVRPRTISSKELDDDNAQDDDGSAEPDAAGDLLSQEEMAQEYAEQRKRAEHRGDKSHTPLLERAEIKKESTGH